MTERTERLWLNVGCGSHRAPSPWWNVDTVRNGNTKPDQIVAPGTALPFPDGSCERIYLGHVLEHVAWPDVPRFLTDVRRLLDGHLLVTGPDVYRTLEEWRAGRLGWDLVTSVLEHAAHPERDNGWPEALHHWNCTEGRVVEALHLAGFTDVEPVSIFGLDGGWPVVGPSAWQMAVRAC